MKGPMLKGVVFCFAALLFATAVQAQLPMPAYVVPVVARAQGAGGSVWRTDLTISNVSDFDVLVSAHFFRENRTNTFEGVFAKPDVVIRAGRTVTVKDVLGSWFPQAGNTKGWLAVVETSPPVCPEPEEMRIPKLAVNARVYNAANPQALFGQTIEALWPTMNFTTFPSIFTGVLNQGVARPGSRTNLGIANISTNPISVRINLYRANGSLAGEATRTVEALSLRQWSLHDQLGLPVLDGNAGRLEVALANSSDDPCFDPAEEPIPGVCDDPCDPACTTEERFRMPDQEVFFAYVSNVDNGSGDGENLLPVMDLIGYAEYVMEYRDIHCPNDSDSAALQRLVTRHLGLERYERLRSRPSFRKLPPLE